MADYAGQISLSHTSDEEHSPHRRRRMSFNNRSAGDSDIMGSSSGEPTNRKPRGRPPGSKNKPKPPVVLAGDSDVSAMKSAVLEIAAGSDVIDTVVQFARKSHLSVSVISGSGSVSNVTLRHTAYHAPSLTLHGPFNILSLTGTFLFPSSSPSVFGICLAGQQGQVFGGVVGGKVTAAGLVVVVVATFKNPAFHRLPGELEEAHEDQQQRPKAKLDGGDGSASGGCSSISMSMPPYGGVASPSPLNSQAPADGFTWGSTSRPSKPY